MNKSELVKALAEKAEIKGCSQSGKCLEKPSSRPWPRVTRCKSLGSVALRFVTGRKEGHQPGPGQEIKVPAKSPLLNLAKL